jgi:hypothetical protein
VRVPGSEPVSRAPRPCRASRLRQVTAGLRDFGRRHRALIAIVGSLATVAVLVFVLAGRRDEFSNALAEATAGQFAAAALLQIVALLARSEAWHLTIEAAGGTVARRVLYRASAVQVLGGMINGQLGVAARIAALRRSSPEVSPQVPTLVAAEFPILAVEGTLAALASFTLVEPLGLPWWLPLVALAVLGAASVGLRHLALLKGRELWKGLTVLRRMGSGSRVIGFVLVAVFASSQLAPTACGRRRGLALRRSRRADRRVDADAASARSRRGCRGRGSHPWPRRGGGGSGRRSADDRDRHGGRPLLRGVGRRRQALVG